MFTKSSCAAAALALLAALATGCSKSSTAPGSNSTSDLSQVNATLTASATLVDDGIDEDNSQVSASTNGLGSGGPPSWPSSLSPGGRT
jgi:hypothetical protein